MAQTYQHLLTLVFKHNYFREGQFKTLQISFDEETGQLLREQGIILKTFAGGMHLLAANPELLNDPALTTPLRLFLTCSDPYFINYSELGNYRPSDTILYFNNLDPNPNSQGTGLQLHSDKYVGQNEVIPLSFGKWAPSNFAPGTDYQFEDVFGNDVSDNIRPSPGHSGTLVISNLSQGIVKVLANGQEEAQLYYQPKSVWKKPLGVLELYAPQLFDHFNNHGKQEYSLNFNTRHTIWKYFLLDPTYQRFDSLSIIDSNKEQIFKAPEKQTVQESQAFVLESIHKIALSEFSGNSFQLVDQFDPGLGTGKVVLNSLPRASPEQLYQEDASSSEAMYSHIYI